MTFIVSDLDWTEALLVKVLDAKRLYDSDDQMFSLSKERFFDIGGVWVAIMQGRARQDQSYDHIAFKIPDDEYDSRLRLIRSLGLEIREGRPRVEGEGRSIYFYDYDNHLFELHSGTLAERLRRYENGSPKA